MPPLPAPVPDLLPAHLEDLQKSGLNPDTIRFAGIHTAKPEELLRWCGRPLPPGTSGLVFPYGPDQTFARVKLFPPIPDGDGHLIRYLQPSGSPVRLYVPPGVAATFDNPEIPLHLPEGEKKALKMVQEKFPSAALGGIWNFRSKDLPPDALIAELEQIPWKGKVGYLVPDSDAWVKDDVKRAVYRFGRLLEDRGAVVFVLQIPTLEGQAKTGVDDYLVAKGVPAFRRLLERKTITLRHPAFKVWQAQEKRDRAQGQEDPTETPPFTDSVPWDAPVDGEELLREIEETLTRYIVFPDPAEVDAIGLWLLAGYAHDAFGIFPMLGVTSPTKRCGKTTLLELICLVAQRALPASNISPASVYHVTERWTPTLILDEADTFTRDNPELKGVINSGHTRSLAFVIRMVGEGATMHPRAFRTWCPKLVCQIGRLQDTWEDRSVVIALKRKGPQDRVARFRKLRVASAIQDVARRCHRWVADHLEGIAALDSDALEVEGLDDRAVDNWQPLLAVAHMIGGGWPDRTRRAAVKLSGGRDAEDDTLGVRLLRGVFAVFESRKENTRVPANLKKIISSAELVEELLGDKEAGWSAAFGRDKSKPLTQRSLASTLKPFGLRSKDLWFPGETVKVVKGYDRDQFADTWQRYGIDPLDPLGANDSADLGAQSDPLGTPPPSGSKSGVSTDEHGDLADLADETGPRGAKASSDTGGVEPPDWSEVFPATPGGGEPPDWSEVVPPSQDPVAAEVDSWNGNGAGSGSEAPYEEPEGGLGWMSMDEEQREEERPHKVRRR